MNLHPFVTHFPIVLICVLFVAEYFSSTTLKFRTVLSVFIAAFTLVSFYSGISEQNRFEYLEPLAEELLKTHFNIGRICLFLSIGIVASYFCRIYLSNESTVKLITFILLIIYMALVIWSGYLGGKLVFDFGLGVVTSEPRVIRQP